MPCCNFPISPIGPVVEIGIAAPLSLAQAGGTPPTIQWIKAIADTGCTTTSIFTDVAKRVGLTVISKTTVNSTTASVAANVYLADLFLRVVIGTSTFEFPFRDRPMLELLRSSPAHEALLGMDVLGIGHFAVNGATKTATFCW